MLKWLGGGKPDHPMYNLKAAEKILAELPGADPGQALGEVCGWIESVSHAAGFKPEVRAAVLQLLDDFGRNHQEKLINQYLGAARIHDMKSRERCQKAYEFWAALSEAYRACLTDDFEIEAGKRSGGDELPVLICRGLRAVASQERVRHLSYQPVDKEVWVRLFHLFRMAEAAGVEGRSVRVYKIDLQHTTPVHELLRALMLEVAAPASLAPEHVELAARTIASIASSFAIAKGPSPALPFCIDLAAPGRPFQYGEKPPAVATARYFGPGEAMARLDELLRFDDASRVPAERKLSEEFTAWDRATVLKHLKRYWGENRPSRGTGRTREQRELSVLHSLSAILTVVTQIGTDQMDTIAETMGERKQTLRLVAEDADVTPEIWIEKDLSESGLGADVPPQRGSWVKIGRLCAVKRADSAHWWVGVIRRLDAPSGARVATGIQVLSKTPYSMWLKLVGKEGGLASNWAASSGSHRYDYVDAVLLVPESEATGKDVMLVIKPSDYKPDMVSEALIGDKPRLIRFGAAVDSGDDFVIVSCQWL